MEFSTRRWRKSFAGKDKEGREDGRKKTDEKREQMVGRSRPGLMPHGGKSPGFIKPSRRVEGRRMKRELAVKFEAVRRINTYIRIYIYTYLPAGEEKSSFLWRERSSIYVNNRKER